MSAALGSGGPSLRLHGSAYPVLLPKLSDPRLHLAAVIVSLQVLGQVAFDFRLSIAQILVSVLTCAVLEVTIAFRRHHVILWPASALLTGNGVAFILRVPGTEHGDWWSLRGWWIFAGTAAVSLLSKYVIRYRGRHVFNPSNFGLVLCFLVLPVTLAEPLDFWWGPMSVWLAVALALIVAGGFAILVRLRLLAIAVGFWLVFAAGIAVLGVTGHEMNASWHLGPITGWEFWRVLVFSPEILVFLFFMITDPKTVPTGRQGRRAFGVAVGLLAVLLIAPHTTEYASKVAVLGALALVCAARPLAELMRARDRLAPLFDLRPRGRVPATLVVAGPLCLGAAVGFAGLVVLAGTPARPGAEAASGPAVTRGDSPPVVVVPSAGVATRIEDDTAREIVLAALAGMGEPASDVERARVTLEPGTRQGPPVIVATLEVTARDPNPASFERTFELAFVNDSFVVVGQRETAVGTPTTAGAVEALPRLPSPAGSVAPGLTDVAREVGLRFRHGSFRFAVTATDPVAMMGGGVCWLDYDGDGWLDLYVVNSYSERDVARWKQAGGLPRSALFRNVKGRFVDVSRASGADLELRGNGCAAADFDLDGDTDLFVTSATYDALLWNSGNGTFSEGARAAGIDEYGWHAGAAVGDLNGDALPDLVVSGYANLNAPDPDSFEGFPGSVRGVRDLLYLNQGADGGGHPTFREVGLQVGLEPGEPEHGLGVVLSDLDGDGRLDLYVANDGDPNRLYLNVPVPGGAAADPAGLGFRLREIAERSGVADPNAGMGIAAADYDGDGLPDLLVTNSRGERHAVYRGRPRASLGRAFADTRTDFAAAFGRSFTGWGASWIDLDLDCDLDLVLANGRVPIASLAGDAEPIQVLENRTSRGQGARFASIGGLGSPEEQRRINGRGLAAADFDNDGDLDVAINTIGGPVVLLESRHATGNWLSVALPGFYPGARLTAVLPDGRKLVREVHAGSSYLSSEDPRVNFGLGEATRVRRLIVRYPDGTASSVADVESNRVLEIQPR
jgi:Na+-translocating ferredoxin:NAD+ oxidoreductase RnfD subunit